MGLAGWNPNQKLKLSIDSSKVDNDLTNFPVNITLSSGTGQTGFDATAVFDELATISGTKNIAITDSNDNQLYVEIERWDWDNEEANLWVRVPTITSSTNTELYFYYDATVSGNTTYIGDTGDSAAQSVWDNNFKLVMHMAQNPNGDVADAIKDSTGNAHHGTPAGAMTSADLVDGKIGKAIDFDENDQIRCGASNDFSFGSGGTDTPFTLECTATADSGGISSGLITKWMTSNQEWLLMLHVGRILIQCCTQTGNYIYKFHNITVSVVIPYYYCSTYNGDKTTDGLGIYENGVFISDTSVGSDSYTGMSNTAQEVVVGSREADLYHDGIIDEVRISNIVRSSAWIKATYYSNWDDLVTFSFIGFMVEFVFSGPAPPHLSTVYGVSHQLQLTTTVTGSGEGTYGPFTYDASFYDSSNDSQIGSTISGTPSGQYVSTIMTTVSATNYSWYVTATASGQSDTSSTYIFSNRFMCSGYTQVAGTGASGIPVRLYKRSTGAYIGGAISSGVSGTFDIPTDYNEYHFVVGFYPTENTNAIIYDWIKPDN